MALICAYLANRRFRTKIRNKYSSYTIIVSDVPQRSILGPLLFNNYICDLFLSVNDKDIVNYTDDTTPYASGDKISTVNLMFNWFTDNQMEGNEDKWHV